MNKTYIQIGLGGFGKTWCQNIVPGITGIAQMTAAVDINPDTFENPMRYCELPREKCYTDLDQALRENPVDFIVIVTPPAFHEQAIDLAVRHGVHIVCEKPFGHDLAACCRIYRKVTEAGLKMIVTMSHRMSQDKQTLETLIRSGRYGRLGYLVGRLAMARRRLRDEKHGPGHNTGAAGLLSEAAIHQLEAMRAISGSNAKRVSALGWNNPWILEEDRPDSVFVTVEMENGVRAFCEQSFGCAAIRNEWGQDYLRAECENASILLDNRQIEVRCDLGFPHPTRESIPMLPGKEQEWGHFLLMRRFAEWLDGGEEPLCSLADNLQCAALTYAAAESYRTGLPLDVQLYLRENMNQIDK